MNKWVVFGTFHLYGLSETSAKKIASLLTQDGHEAVAMSEQDYRHRHHYQGRISTDV